MTAEVAAELIKLLEEDGLEIYVDGGWAVDALLGQQTRAHQDLDIALPDKHVPRLRDLLSRRGYREQSRPGTWECNFVLVEASGTEVDVHSYTLDEAGNNIHGVAYKSEHLTGRGFINGYPVRCISPEWLVRFHSGYTLDENDYHDVRALCERFGIALPDECRRFIKVGSTSASGSS
jgi:lincosamide nucleotidyltransferase A/C/D/E